MSSILKLDYASHEAATHAVMSWHYSKRMPIGKLVKIGAWEDGTFIGCIIFGRGASPFLGAPFNLKQTECVELVRVALKSHKTPVSRICAIALRMLKLVVSFADPEQGHHGGIYQAGGWVYGGNSGTHREFFADGTWRHERSVGGKGSNAIDKFPTRKVMGKLRYLMPLDRDTATSVAKLAKPYPKKPHAVAVVDRASAPPTPGVQPDPAAP